MPLHKQKCQKGKIATQTTPEKCSISERLRTDLGRLRIMKPGASREMIIKTCICVVFFAFLTALLRQYKRNQVGFTRGNTCIDLVIMKKENGGIVKR